jgi:hypothetical protein
MVGRMPVSRVAFTPCRPSVTAKWGRKPRVIDLFTGRSPQPENLLAKATPPKDHLRFPLLHAEG